MVFLSPNHRAKLHDCILEILHAALKELAANSPGKIAATFSSTVHELVAAVHSVSIAAAFEFKCIWNGSHPDPLLRLPVELCVQCFRPLADTERLAVSHVSRAWRRIALSERALWAEAKIGPGARDNAAKLSTFLSRSHPLPFLVTLRDLPDADVDALFPLDADVDALFPLLVENLARFRSITISFVLSTTIARIFEHPAPLLERLTFYSGWNDPCPLPGIWATHLAPQLRILEMGVFSVPEDLQLLSSVREFQCFLPLFGLTPTGANAFSGLRNVFAIFPRLEKLSLHNVRAQSLACVPQLPQTLVKLSLAAVQTADIIGVAYAEFLEFRVHNGLNKLSVDGVFDVAACVDACAAKMRGAWTMTITEERDEFSVSLNNNDATGARCFLRPKYRRWWTSTQPFMRRLDRLRRLVLPLSAFVDVCYKLDPDSWDRALPGLWSLALTADSKKPFARADSILAAHQAAPRPVHAAQLRDVTLEMPNAPLEVECITVSFPAMLPLLVTHGRPRLKLVAIEARHAETLLDEDLTAIRSLARRTVIWDFATGQDVADDIAESSTAA